jgi:ribosomal protein S15P/S13E
MDSLSIHPRAWRGGLTGDRVKQNVCAPKQRATVARVIAAIEGHLKHHPHDAMSAARLVKLRAKLATLSA